MSDGQVGLLDTSVVTLLPRLTDPALLPDQPAISAITLAELSVGPLDNSPTEPPASLAVPQP